MATIATGDGSEVEQIDIARVVRRALADAGLKATLVTALVVDDALVHASDLVAFGRLALGGRSADVDVALAPSSRVIGSAVAASIASDGVSLAVFGAGGVAVALCLAASPQRPVLSRS